MFFPPYRMLEKYVRRRQSDDGGDEVAMHPEVFVLLVRCALENCEFDEAQYQRCNPDVAEAVERNEMPSGRDHYVQTGYFEGRVGAMPVHEAWYLSQNPDVAAAKEAGLIESGEAQWRLAGCWEWREPNPGVAPALRAWKELLSRTEEAT